MKIGKFIQVPEDIEIAKKVIRLKQRGAGYGEIAGRVGLKISTVRMILKHKELYS
jgi:orotate phosphoribosyltransferase-like protein